MWYIALTCIIGRVEHWQNSGFVVAEVVCHVANMTSFDKADSHDTLRFSKKEKKVTKQDRGDTRCGGTRTDNRDCLCAQALFNIHTTAVTLAE